MKEDPAEDAKCKDKFLVQSAAITGDLEALPLTDIVSLTVCHALAPSYDGVVVGFGAQQGQHQRAKDSMRLLASFGC
jgi:hypothetical protein